MTLGMNISCIRAASTLNAIASIEQGGLKVDCWSWQVSELQDFRSGSTGAELALIIEILSSWKYFNFYAPVKMDLGFSFLWHEIIL